MYWIESSGGPLILIEKIYLKEWGGVDCSSDSNYSSDYDRACDTDEYAEVISIPSGQAVVFGDEPNRTTVVTKSGSEAIIIRWRWAPNEAEILKYLGEMEQSDFDLVKALHLRLRGEEVVVFDSSFKGAEASKFLNIRLRSGEFVLETAMFEPDNETCLLLHRLRLID